MYIYVYYIVHLQFLYTKYRPEVKDSQVYIQNIRPNHIKQLPW